VQECTAAILARVLNEIPLSMGPACPEWTELESRPGS